MKEGLKAETKAMEGLGGVLVGIELRDQSQGFRCKKREKRDDSRPGCWECQGGIDWKIGDAREQEQGRLGKENVQREKVVLYIV